jgi:hypothetical protein
MGSAMVPAMVSKRTKSEGQPADATDVTHAHGMPMAQPRMMPMAQPGMPGMGMPNSMMAMMQMMIGGGMGAPMVDPLAAPFSGQAVADGDTGLDADILRLVR